MSIQDAQEFGPIVEQLLGQTFERTLAANSLKLRFGTQIHPKGTHYIWIDPPWNFLGPDGLIAQSSHEYTKETFGQWAQKFLPIDHNTLTSWSMDEDGTVRFIFATGHSLVLPSTSDERDPENWYAHWYAHDRMNKSSE